MSVSYEPEGRVSNHSGRAIEISSLSSRVPLMGETSAASAFGACQGCRTRVRTLDTYDFVISRSPVQAQMFSITYSLLSSQLSHLFRFFVSKLGNVMILPKSAGRGMCSESVFYRSHSSQILPTVH